MEEPAAFAENRNLLISSHQKLAASRLVLVIANMASHFSFTDRESETVAT